MIFSDLCSVEHSVETGHLVNLHGCHLKDLGNLVHCGKSQEVVVLLLSDKQNRDDTGRFVVVWVLLEKSFDCCVRFLGEFEGAFRHVVFRVSVIGKGRGERESLSGAELGHSLHLFCLSES